MNADVALGLAGALVTMLVVFEMLRRRRLREKYAVLWILVALVTVVLAVVPSVLTWASALVGVALPANLLFFGACMLLLIVSIQHSYEIGRLEDRTQTLAEEVALLSLEQERLRRAAGDVTSPAESPRPAVEDDRSSEA